MSTIGDIIPQLSYSTTGVISATGTIWESQPYAISEYNSISMIMLAGADTTVQLAWSADGVVYNYSQFYPFISGVSDQAADAIASKWLQITISNTHGITGGSGVNFQLYATNANNAVSALLQGITAKTLPKIDVSNSFQYTGTGELLTESFVPDQQYTFNHCSGTGGTGTTGTTGRGSTFETTYDDLNYTTFQKQYAYNSNTTNVVIGQGCIKLTAMDLQNSWSVLNSTAYTKWMPGSALSCIFSAAFQPSYFTNGASGCAQLLMGMATPYANNISTPYEGVLIGYGGTLDAYLGTGGTGPNTPLNTLFGISIYRFGDLYKFIPQVNWNIDTANGDVVLPATMNWSLANIFKITIVPQGSLLISVVNPSTGLYTPVHYEALANNSTIGSQATFSDASFGLYAIEFTVPNQYPTPNYSIIGGLYMMSWMIGFETTEPKYKIDNFQPTIINSALSGGIGNILTFTRGPANNLWFAPSFSIYNSPLFNSYPNYTTVYIDSINITFAYTGATAAQPIGYQIYTNISATQTTGPTGWYNYSSISASSPVQVANTNTTQIPTFTTAQFGAVVPVVTNVLFPTNMPNQIYMYTANADLSQYKIKLYPNFYLFVLIIWQTSSNSSPIGGGTGFADIGTTVAFHQLH